MRRAVLLPAGLIALAAASACPGHHGSTPPVVTVILDGSPDASDTYELAVDDSSGALVTTLPLVLPETRVQVPANGSLSLRISSPTLGAFFRTWVAPPAGALLHTRAIAEPSPAPTVSVPITWNMTLDGAPPGTTVSYRVLAYCHEVASVSSSGLLIDDLGCPQSSSTTILGLALDSAGNSTAWGATTTVMGTPGQTVDYGQALDFPTHTHTVSFSGLPPGAHLRANSTLLLPQIPPVANGVVLDATAASASLELAVFDGTPFTFSTEAFVASSSDGVTFAQSFANPDAAAIDASGFPSAGARTVSPGQWTFSLASPFGEGVWIVSGAKPDLIVWLPATATSFRLPDFPASWGSVPASSALPAIGSRLIDCDGAPGDYPTFLDTDFFSPGAPAAPAGSRTLTAVFTP